MMFVKVFPRILAISCYYSQSDKKWQSDSSSEACKKPIDSFYLTGISHFTHISKKSRCEASADGFADCFCACE
jgi:hypothetical protein